MSADRPPIPDPIKREVRQRCGFGCVICGQSMLWDYDHIEEYSKVLKHEAPNIVLLCPNHHREKTNKLLSTKRLLEANQNPYNIRHGQSSKHTVDYYGKDFRVVIGTMVFSISNPLQREIDAFVINRQPIISYRIEDSHPLLNVNIFDSNGNKVLMVVDNEVQYKINTWDIEVIGRRIIVREGSRKIVVDIEFYPDQNMVRIINGNLTFDGITAIIHYDTITVAKDGILQPGSVVGGGGSGPVGLAIGARTDKPAAVRISIFEPGMR